MKIQGIAVELRKEPFQTWNGEVLVQEWRWVATGHGVDGSEVKASGKAPQEAYERFWRGLGIGDLQYLLGTRQPAPYPTLPHKGKIWVAGPGETIGNQFAFYGQRLEAGQFSLVEWGEYANGGRGWSSIDGRLYESLEAAVAALGGWGEVE